MEEKTFVGYSYGTFRDDGGVEHEYCSAFMLEDFPGEQSDSRHFGGRCAVKYKCEGPAVFQKIPPGSLVKCYFTSKGRLAFMQLAGGKD